jgi:TRAP-type transport system small permease protein
MKGLLTRCCGLLAGSALFAIMALTLVDVAGRKLFSASVPGSLELTEILMVVVIFASLPLVSQQGEHVVFDSLDSKLSSTTRRLQCALVDLLCAGALGGLAWLMWAKAGQMASYGDITSQLKLPVSPFVYAMAVLCAITAAVHAVHVWRPAVHTQHLPTQ